MTASGATGPAWWSRFPVDAEPRPLILFGHRVNPPGFATNGAKLAWLDGAVAVTAEVPDAVARAVSTAPHGTPADHVDHVVVDRGTRIVHPFLTDRGDVSLPAWRLHGPELLDDGCVVLDPEVHTWWSLDEHPEAAAIAGNLAVVDESGRHVRWPAVGGMFTEYLGVEFEEFDSYVVGRVSTRYSPPPGVTWPDPGW